MNSGVILASFFAFVMGSVVVAGGLWSARAEAGGWSLRRSSRAFLKQTLLRVGEAVPSRPTQERSYRRKLILAGYRQANAVHIFLGMKIALALAAGSACLVLRMITNPDLGLALLSFIASGALFFMIPDRILDYAIQSRSRRILFGIPTALDLLILTLEAGQALDAAISETSRELRPGFPELSAELNQVSLEMAASRSRQEALANLRDRNVETELKRMAQVLIDADRFGASVAPALRTHVKFLRPRLRQQAQEQARKVSVKLVFPVFFLIFPAVLLVTLGPAVLQVFAQLNILLGK